MQDETRSRVAIVSCNKYEPDLLSSKVVEVLNLLGGLDKYIRPGMKVLLKPNLLSAKAPERGITTHPELVAAVAREVRKLGATVIVGDSPGGAKRGVKRVWENTGMLTMAEREGIELVNFESGGVVPFAIDGKKYFLAKPAVEADFIINLPKLKTHVLMLMTGAVKNMFGLIPGFRKGQYHKEAPKSADFAQIIVDILSLRPPQLTIMDAILTMEGDGPSSGEPRWANLILASTDPVAIDVIAAEIIGLRPDKVQTTRIAAEAGLGAGWPELIDVIGEQIDNIKIPDFKLTSNRALELIPGPLAKLAGRLVWVRPAIDNLVCTKCNICVTSCPTGALSNNNGEIPSFNYDRCINCWCCHELCPSKALFVDQSWLAKKFIR